MHLNSQPFINMVHNYMYTMHTRIIEILYKICGKIVLGCPFTSMFLVNLLAHIAVVCLDIMRNEIGFYDLCFLW